MIQVRHQASGIIFLYSKVITPMHLTFQKIMKFGHAIHANLYMQTST